VNPYVFIVGCSRSGTTLVRRIADTHPQLAVMPEQQWLPRYWEWRVGMTPDGTVTSDLLDLLLADRRYALLELPFKPIADLVENGPPLRYPEFVGALFDMYGAERGKKLVGEKTPKYVRFLQTLVELWPSSRIVHVIRDGRDVALSLLEWDKNERNVGRYPTWAVDPMTTAALYWESSVRAGRDVADRLGPERYHELRYESLVAAPEEESAALCSFLALPYDSRMLEFNVGRRSTDRDGRKASAKKGWQPITAGLRNWRHQMPPAELARFEAAAGDLLDELGYERGERRPSQREREHAARLREAFAERLVRVGRPVPRAWRSAAA
jgi:hypothetical protein